MSMTITCGFKLAAMRTSARPSPTVATTSYSGSSSLILALALVAVLGAGLTNVIVLVSVVFIPQFGRVARAQTIAIRNSLFLEAEQVLGTQPWRILLHHVLPNIIGPIFVLSSMNIPVVITIEAGLSFLGVGIRPPLASWGGLLHDGYTYLDQSPWLAVFSGLALIFATLGFTLLGEALRDASTRSCGNPGDGPGAAQHSRA